MNNIELVSADVVGNEDSMWLDDLEILHTYP